MLKSYLGGLIVYMGKVDTEERGKVKGRCKRKVRFEREADLLISSLSRNDIIEDML